MKLGLISDTHGLLRPEAIAALSGAQHILHAGDVGSPDVLDELGRIAPVTAVRGNTDHGPWAEKLPRTAEIELGRHWFHVLHILEDLDLEPAAAGFSVVLYGHSHRPDERVSGGVLYLNPGSAGPRRFRLPVTIALLDADRPELRPQIVELP